MTAPLDNVEPAATLSPIRAVAFDAYGTLFDVYSISVLAEEFFPGCGRALAELWRERQIEYTRLRTLSARYIPFDEVTRDALIFCARKLGLDLSAAQRDALMQQYDRLSLFSENAAALEKMAAMGVPLAILSNGNPAMLDALVAHAGIEKVFNFLLSADTVQRFKTASEVYQLGPDALGIPVQQILFVSSNCWDACAATWFGYHTFWINRSGQPLEELGIQPHASGANMNDVLAYLTAARH